MTIQEVQNARDQLAAQLQSLVDQFEQTTGAQIHSIPVIHGTVTTVEVKVQIP
jgi:hypothetical protein